jgi:hypothetical protein
MQIAPQSRFQSETVPKVEVEGEGGQTSFWLQKTDVSRDRLINIQRVYASKLLIYLMIVHGQRSTHPNGHTSQV